MFSSANILILLAVSLMPNFINGQVPPGCIRGFKKWTKDMQEFKLNSFRNNCAAKGELLKLKVYYNGETPLFSVYNSGNQVTFGMHKNLNTFGIFKTYKDLRSDGDPCVISKHVNLFKNNSWKSYIGVDFAITEDGRFSVQVEGDNGFSMVCKTGFNFSTLKETSVFIDYSWVMDYWFAYDCPCDINKG
ncbi:hypothetical protein ACFFRR_000314 [Megaselia abdita]